MPCFKVVLRDEVLDDYPHLDVRGVGRIYIDENGDEFLGPLDVINDANLSDLRRALIGYFGTEPPPPRSITFDDPETGESVTHTIGIPSGPERGCVSLVDVPVEKFGERRSYEFLPEPVALALLTGGLLTVRLVTVLEGEDEPDQAAIRTRLAPLLEKRSSRIAHISAEPQGELAYLASPRVRHPDFWTLAVYVAVPLRGRCARSALAIGRDALALLEASPGGALTREAVEGLLRSGSHELLIGQPEGSWLECKQQPYSADERGGYEFAKDVVSFANSEGGGLLVLGLRTRRVRGRDTIASSAPIPFDPRRAQRYRALLRRWIYPSLVGLSLEEVECETGSLLIVSIPSQPSALKPFLVRGTLQGEKVLGSHLAAYWRSGDDTVSMSAEELHTLIVAGRASLGYGAQSRSPGA